MSRALCRLCCAMPLGTVIFCKLCGREDDVGAGGVAKHCASEAGRYDRLVAISRGWYLLGAGRPR